MLRSKKTYLIGVPLALVGALVALFVWGELQPRPPGYAPTAAAIPVENASAPARAAAPEPVATSEAPAAVAASVAAVVEPAGPFQYTIDARDREQWVFFDFSRGSTVESDFDRADWQLAFRRTGLLTNSGETNALGPAGVADLGEVDLVPEAVPPDPAFAVDALGGEDGDEVRNPAIPKWYRYNFIRHVIIAKPNVYLIRTGGDRDALVRFESYYCEDGSPGCVTFHYRLVARVD